MMRLAEFLGWIGLAVMFVPLCIGWFRWHNLTSLQRWLTVLITLTTANMTVSVAVGYLLERNNLLFYHIYVILEGVFLLVLLQQLTAPILHKYLFVFLLAGFTGFWTWSLWAGPSYLTFPSHARALESFLVLFLTIAYWVSLPVSSLKHLWSTPAWWMSLGWGIYFAGNLLLFSYSNFVQEQATGPEYGLIWTLHGILNLWLYGTYARALSCSNKLLYGKPVSV